MATHDDFMTCALEEAQKAYEKGEVPIGAVVVLNGEIIGRGHNLRETTHQATAHAELLAIQDANTRLGKWRLEDCTLYVTLEPCPMCSGAIILSRLREVVYGARDEKAGTCGTLMNLVEDVRFNHQAHVVSGVMETECKAILQRFFKALRQRNKQFKLKGLDKEMMKDVQNILLTLQDRANDARLKHLQKNQIEPPYFGVAMADVKALAKVHAKNNALALALFDTHYLETELMSVYMFDAKTIDKEALLRLADTTDREQVLDELVDKVIAKRKDSVEFELAWQAEAADKYQRLAWGVRMKRMAKEMAADDLRKWVTVAKEQLPQKTGRLQWQMNRFLVEVAVKHPMYREEIVEFGERLGLYADDIVPKGCYRAYIPEWVGARVL